MLLGHFQAPRTTYNCFYGVESGNTESWGTAAAVSALQRASQAVTPSYGRIAVGDLSHIHGGDIDGHASHEIGLDADLRLITTSRDQCASPTAYTRRRLRPGRDPDPDPAAAGDRAGAS